MAKKTFNEEAVTTSEGVFKVAKEARVPRETIQRHDKYLVVEKYAAIIGTPWQAPDGTEIITAERIPVVKLSRDGKPLKATVLWVSQICPQDVNRLYVFEDNVLNDARQEGQLIDTIKGKVLTAVSSSIALMRKWDNENGGYMRTPDDEYVGTSKAAFNFSAADPAVAVDMGKAESLIEEYLNKNYAGLLA